MPIYHKYQRPKAKYKTARGAWSSIARKTRKRAVDVIRTGHTAKNWVFLTK